MLIPFSFYRFDNKHVVSLHKQYMINKQFAKFLADFLNLDYKTSIFPEKIFHTESDIFISKNVRICRSSHFAIKCRYLRGIITQLTCNIYRLMFSCCQRIILVIPLQTIHHQRNTTSYHFEISGSIKCNLTGGTQRSNLLNVLLCGK